MLYTFHKNIILRSPINDFQTGYSINFKHPLSKNNIEKLFLASPTLTKKIANTSYLEEFNNTLLKYHLRSIFRCTPFGLFAGVSIVNWSHTTDIQFVRIQRRTTVDTYILNRIIESLNCNRGFRSKAVYFSNDSLYELDKRIRFIERTEITGNRKLKLNEVNNNKVLNEILKRTRHGATFNELSGFLVTAGYKKAESETYINCLIDNQIIVSELGLSITGDEFIDQLINKLSKYSKFKNISNTLCKTKILLQNLDQNVINELSEYDQIIKLLDTLKITGSNKRMFHVDIIRNTCENSLNNNIKRSLEEGLTALFRLVPENSEEKSMNRFIERFTNRFGEEEHPLSNVLDNEFGVGYPKPVAYNPISIIKNISVPDRNLRITNWTRRNQKLFYLFQKTILERKYELQITTEDLKDFESYENKIPPSFYIIFKITDFEHDRILLEHVGGESATKIISRFAHLDKKINKMVIEIASEEQSTNPDVIFAEIVHFPDFKMGDVFKRPKLRKYEIPILSQSSVDRINQIPVSDLYVSIAENKVILRSKKLNKRIIPCLSNAHDHTLSELPIYRFLCDLQATECINSFTFRWGSWAEDILFLPRVIYGKAILHLATWNLPREEWLFLLNKTDAEKRTVIDRFRSKWRMPRYIVVVEGDHELFIDLECTNTIDLFLATIKNHDKITLKEFIFDKNTPIRDIKGRPYANQFVAPVLRTCSVYSDVRKKSEKKRKPIQSFIPGTEWVYYKFYCSASAADDVLTKYLKPLVNNLLKEKVIDLWFFIRYEDPDNHLRIRFHLTEMLNIQILTKYIGNISNKMTRHGKVSRIATDTYVRELDRYGNETLSLAEKLFYIDSQDIILFLHKSLTTTNEDTRWLWGMKVIDTLLDCFKLLPNQKVEVMRQLDVACTHEFQLDKSAILLINKDYRKYVGSMEHVLIREPDRSVLPDPLLKLIESSIPERSDIIAEIMAATPDTHALRDYLKSYIHMHLNRLLNSDHRLSEMVIYKYMYK
jgi:thiopeptide-type bacteriocin biosynthesis protein